MSRWLPRAPLCRPQTRTCWKVPVRGRAVGARAGVCALCRRPQAHPAPVAACNHPPIHGGDEPRPVAAPAPVTGLSVCFPPDVRTAGTGKRRVGCCSTPRRGGHHHQGLPHPRRVLACPGRATARGTSLIRSKPQHIPDFSHFERKASIWSFPKFSLLFPTKMIYSVQFELAKDFSCVFQ